MISLITAAMLKNLTSKLNRRTAVSYGFMHSIKSLWLYKLICMTLFVASVINEPNAHFDVGKKNSRFQKYWALKIV